MNLLVNLLLTVQILAALGMIGLILIQHGKGADMGAAFGSGSSGNATLIEGSDGLHTRRLLVDCGLGIRQLDQRLQRAGLAADDIDAIFVTHEHSDHIGCARQLAMRHQIPVWMSHGTHAGVGSPDFQGLLQLALRREVEVGGQAVEEVVGDHHERCATERTARGQRGRVVVLHVEAGALEQVRRDPGRERRVAAVEHPAHWGGLVDLPAARISRRDCDRLVGALAGVAGPATTNWAASAPDDVTPLMVRSALPSLRSVTEPDWLCSRAEAPAWTPPSTASKANSLSLVLSA